MINYAEIARDARIKVLDLIYQAQTSHIGSNFSCIDLMAVIFEHLDLDKDKFILSKGWAAASLYYFLWRKGRITEEELNSYCQEGSKFIGLTEPVIPEIPFAGGSMGMGLPAAVGMAMAKKSKGEGGRIFVLMSDGELQCGTTWESVLIAQQHKLDNLRVFVDCNGLQAMGPTADILAAADVDCWLQTPINGHNYSQIDEVINKEDNFVMAETVKGKGVSFMEGENIWHYKAPEKEEYERAKQELCQK